MLARAYRQCRRGVAYWLPEDEDLETILPNFHAKRVGARAGVPSSPTNGVDRAHAKRTTDEDASLPVTGEQPNPK